MADHYRAIDEELADRLLDRIVEAPLILLTQPALGPAIGPHGTRKWNVAGTPFILIYRLLPDGIVEVLHVRHNRTDWRRS